MLERLRYSHDVDQADVPGSTLDIGDVRAVQVGEFRQFLLGEIELRPALPDSTPKGGENPFFLLAPHAEDCHRL